MSAGPGRRLVTTSYATGETNLAPRASLRSLDMLSRLFGTIGSTSTDDAAGTNTNAIEPVSGWAACGTFWAHFGR